MRVKTEAKRREILEGAAAVFRQHGFSQASMSAVSQRIGGSKATLYRYFASKEDLFFAVMFEATLEHANDVFDGLAPGGDLRLTLERFGAGYLSLALSAEAISVRRMSIAEGSRSGIGKLLFERGPKLLWSKMAAFLDGEMAAGRLRKADPWMVAMHFRGLLEGDLVNRALLGVAVDSRSSCLRVHACAAADVLLRAYAAESPARASIFATDPAEPKDRRFRTR
ncbi:MAG TPA: TetR/AcrR family transcriptional regulator [Caulobacteraceae bacterium]